MLPGSWFQRPGREGGWVPTAPAGAPTVVLVGQGFRVAVRPEARPDIAVEAPAGVGIRIDRRGRDVSLQGGDPSKRPRRTCPASLDQPLVVVRAPLDVAVRVEGEVSGALGGVRNLLLANEGCGAWSVASAEDSLRLIQRGPGRIRVGVAKTVQLRMRGRGEVWLGHAQEGLDAYLEGPGRVHARRVDGRLDAELWGSGSLAVEEGFVTRAVAFVQGRGKVAHRGLAGTLYADTRGGLVEIAQVQGMVTVSIKGDGDVRYTRPKTGRYCLGVRCEVPKRGA